MPRRPASRCTVPGCAALAPSGGRCPAHRRITNRDRWTARKAERYDAEHRRWRRWWLRQIQDGAQPLCPRCGAPVSEQWFDLDHLPDGYEVPSHRHCNRSAGARGDG
jgi:hypothetical protein